MVSHFKTFGSGDLDLSECKETTGTEYLNAILKEKKGACRHRALAFVEEMKKCFPKIPTRILSHDCHAFVEVLINNQWIKCDLGGYPVRLDIVDQAAKDKKGPNRYDKFMETWTENTLVPADNLFSFYQQLVQSNESLRKSLIELDSADAVSAMVLGLQRYCNAIKRPVFYINEASDLIL
jgi:hypothetical protein